VTDDRDSSAPGAEAGSGDSGMGVLVMAGGAAGALLLLFLFYSYSATNKSSIAKPKAGKRRTQVLPAPDAGDEKRDVARKTLKHKMIEEMKA